MTMTTKTQQLLTITLKSLLRYVVSVAVITLIMWAVWSAHHWLATAVWLVAALLLSAIPAVSAGMKAYRTSIRATTEHQEYLMGNGATRHETLLPSRQRGLRAALVCSLRTMKGVSVLTTMLVLTALMLSGLSPVKAAILVVLLTVGSLLTSIAMTIICMWNSERKEKA